MAAGQPAAIAVPAPAFVAEFRAYPAPRTPRHKGRGARRLVIAPPGTARRMTDNDSAVWRNEERLPLSELERAMATSAGDGQVEDVTGNDAGAEAAFGHGPEAADGRPDIPDTGREMTDEDRAYRPSTTGRTGPH